MTTCTVHGNKECGCMIAADKDNPTISRKAVVETVDCQTQLKLEADLNFIKQLGFVKETVGNVTTWRNQRAEELESQVRDLTRPIDGTFVLSAEPTKEEISQARQVIGQLQREVRDLTGEREGLITERDELANELRMLDYNHRALETKHSGLRDTVERLANDKHEALLAKAEAEEKAAIINSELFEAKKEISKAEALYNHLYERTTMLERQLAGMRGA